MTAKENCDTKKGQEEIQKGEFHFVTLRKWRRKKIQMMSAVVNTM